MGPLPKSAHGGQSKHELSCSLAASNRAREREGAALGANVWQLENLTFDPSPDARDEHGAQWFVLNEKGFWGSPGTTATTTKQLNKHGAFRSPGWQKERIVSLIARCYAPSYDLLRSAQAHVLGLLSDPRAPGKLICHSEIGSLALDVFLDDKILCTPLQVISEPGFEFSVQMVAPDPVKYSVERQAMSSGLARDTLDGLDFSQVVQPDVNQGLFFGMGADDDGLSFGTSNATGFMPIRSGRITDLLRTLDHLAARRCDIPAIQNLRREIAVDLDSAQPSIR